MLTLISSRLSAPLQRHFYLSKRALASTTQPAQKVTYSGLTTPVLNCLIIALTVNLTLQTTWYHLYLKKRKIETDLELEILKSNQ
jgi:hypothetical protein